MSYEHGTPFVNLPQTVGSDKRDWFDTNEAYRDLDAKLKTAYEGAGSSAEGLVEVNARVDEVNTTVSQHTTQIEELSAHLGTTDENVAVNSTAINGLQTEVRDNKQDLKDSICSIEEQTATAQYRHEVGTYFWYNDTLYKTTVLIAVNQQIVPNVNCDTTNITTELLNMEPETIANVVRYNTGTGKMEYNDNGTWTEIPASTITASDVGYGTSSNVGDALDGINDELTADNDTKFQFGYSGGKYGYKVGGTFHPFETGNGYFFSKTRSVSLAAGATETVTFDFSGELSSITQICSYGVQYNSSDPYHFAQVTACSYSGTTVTMTVNCPSTQPETRIAMVTVKGTPV